MVAPHPLEPPPRHLALLQRQPRAPHPVFGPVVFRKLPFPDELLHLRQGVPRRPLRIGPEQVEEPLLPPRPRARSRSGHRTRCRTRWRSRRRCRRRLQRANRGNHGSPAHSAHRRPFFFSPALLFSSILLSFAARLGRVLCRGGGRYARRASFSRSRSSAADRFCPRERWSLPSAATPVGRCTSRTAVSALLRCCPPGPPARCACTSHCASSWGSGSSCHAAMRQRTTRAGPWRRPRSAGPAADRDR